METQKTGILNLYKVFKFFKVQLKLRTVKSSLCEVSLTRGEIQHESPRYFLNVDNPEKALGNNFLVSTLNLNTHNFMCDFNSDDRSLEIQ